MIGGIVALIVVSIIVAVIYASNTSDVNTNSNVNIVNVNTSQTANKSSNRSDAGNTIETREPGRYRATVIREIENVTKSVSSPSLSAEVARDGGNSRISFTLP
jgi:hypothetical protein